LFDCLVVQPFNSENRENFTRSLAKKSASLEHSRRSISSTSTRARAEGYNSITNPTGESFGFLKWLAQPRAGKPVNFPALLSIVLRKRGQPEKQNTLALESEVGWQ
jgi:hypothetical protein